MRISSKGRYAVRLMAELARREGENVSVADIADAQDISAKYLEKIISILSKNRLIEGSRGVKGGYKLTKPADKYSVAEILCVTGDLPELAPCLRDGYECARADKCDSVGCWERLDALINNYLSKVSLQDILDKKY